MCPKKGTQRGPTPPTLAAAPAPAPRQLPTTLRPAPPPTTTTTTSSSAAAIPTAGDG